MLKIFWQESITVRLPYWKIQQNKTTLHRLYRQYLPFFSPGAVGHV
jgi:hypothetical protein